MGRLGRVEIPVDVHVCSSFRYRNFVQPGREFFQFRSRTFEVHPAVGVHRSGTTSTIGEPAECVDERVGFHTLNYFEMDATNGETREEDTPPL